MTRPPGCGIGWGLGSASGEILVCELSGALVGENLVHEMVRGSLLYLGFNSGFIPHPRVVVLNTQGARGDVFE